MDQLYDKIATLQVLGCLLQSPDILSSTDRYRLTIDDFESKLTRGIFGAIYNMYQSGAHAITEIDIDTYLSSKSSLHKEFIENNGIELLQDAKEIAQLGNFPYYYDRVKKFSALRDLNKNGFNIADIYDTSLIGSSKLQEQDRKLDSLSIQDIFQHLQGRFMIVEEKYTNDIGSGSISAFDGIKEQKEMYKTSPEVGPNFQNVIFNTVVRGARKGKFYLDAGSSGSGKTRKMVGHACYLAYPYLFNSNTGEWENTGNCEKVLIITTELEPEEIQSLILASITGINEEIILYGQYTPEEEAIADQGIKIMEYYKNNLRIEQLPNPSRSNVVSCMRRHHILYGTENIFYDYIFSSPNLLNEYRDLRVREDVVLMMMSTALKDVAVELGVFIWSATQLSGDFNNHKGIRNQSFLRSAKSIADKADVGMITLPVTSEELDLLNQLIVETGIQRPTHVIDIYKVRRGRYNEVKIWGIHDLGTCRTKDILITDARLNPIPHFKIIKYYIESNMAIPQIEDILTSDSTLNNTDEIENKEDIFTISPIDNENIKQDIEKTENTEVDWSSLLCL